MRKRGFFRPPPRAGAITLHTPAQNEPPLPPPPLRGPAAAHRVPVPRGPPEKPAAAPAPRGPPDLAPFAPVPAAPPRRRGTARPRVRARHRPAVPAQTRAPFFRRAAAQGAPRLCPAETAAAPRPVCPPEGRRPRRPGPCRPSRGVPAAPGARPALAGVCPRPPAAPPGVCPQGGIKSQGVVCRRPRPPLT